MRTARPPTSLGPWLGAPLLAMALMVALGALAWPFTIDDAFVLARYAQNLAAGGGYAMNAGVASDGVTGPLALLPAWLGELFLGDPVSASKGSGLVATALAVGMTVRAAAHRTRLEGWLALALLGCGSTLAVWSVAGLETGLATLAVTLGTLAVLEKPSRSGLTCRPARRAAPLACADSTRAPLRSSLTCRPARRAAPLACADSTRAPLRSSLTLGLAVFALAWLRPELAVASVVLLAALTRSDPRAARVAWAIALLGASSVVAFRLAMFGSPLPLSAQAKPPDLANGGEYVARAVVVALGGGGPIVAFLGAREGTRDERLLFGLLLAHLAALVLAGGDWMPGFRLLAPLLPAYALLVVRPIAARLAAPGRRLAGALALAGCLLIPVLDTIVQMGPVRQAGAHRESEGAELADWLGANATRVAMVDVGYLAFRSGVEVVDLGGITDPTIARLPGGHLDKRIDPGLLRERAPDVLVLHASAPPRVDGERRLLTLAGYPVERRVAHMPWVRAQFRVARVIRYSPAYSYAVLTREDPLPQARHSRQGSASVARSSWWSTSSHPAFWWPRLRCAMQASSAPWWCSSSTAPRARSAS